jgi:hypothetical protein
LLGRAYRIEGSAGHFQIFGKWAEEINREWYLSSSGYSS